jgi:uncharacterized protein YkwD
MKLSILGILLVLTFFTAPQYDRSNEPAVCTSPEEKRLYDLIMNYRKHSNLKSIPLSAKLTLVAQTHARDLAENYKFNEDSICNPHSWSAKGKWSSCCYTADHKQAKCMWDKPTEISGYNSPGYEIAYYNSVGAAAESSLEGWKRSSSHNPLLVNSGIWAKADWNAIGVGIFQEFAVVWFGQIKDTTATPELCK